MSATVFTGWRTVTPGRCLACGSDDWSCDGRGNILCSCQSCPDCGILDAYGFHEAGCPQLDKPCQTCGTPIDPHDDYCADCAADWSQVAYQNLTP